MRNLDKIRKKYINEYNNRRDGFLSILFEDKTLKDLNFEEFLLLKIQTAESEVSALVEELRKHNPPIVQEIDKLVSETITELEKAKKAFEKGKKDFQEEYR